MNQDLLHSHSAIVQMFLILRERTWKISQIGPDFIILSHPEAHPPDTGEIVLQVDGHEKRKLVRLPLGITVTNPKTQIQKPEIPSFS